MPQLHILQHKSWHVYNQENRDRVSRDEEKARQEEEEKEKKIVKAESEHRLALLRKKAQERLQSTAGGNTPEIQSTVTSSSPSRTVVATTPIQVTKEEEERGSKPLTKQIATSSQPKPEHINFWADYEKKSVVTSKGNPEYEADKKKEQDKWDRQITKYLGDVVKGKEPWYAKQSVSHDTVEHYDGSQKSRQDPLSSINKFVAKKKSDKEHQEMELLKQTIERERRSKRRSEGSANKRDREDGHKSKKEKKSKHKHKHSSKSSSKSEKTIYSPEIQKLRDEWYQKEKQRRERAERLLEYEKNTKKAAHQGIAASGDKLN
ncbi:hypothetical protein K493DRAFT_352937 [Basidiobolus meristosporus CBS 931.73]|uniref:CBF1-interacting co-repressor CIR N-terminal domain-containing protein n=1 Tax=Basidiobolus meristosporus CBS 931.73 TaxID=1314790 RepID=A0A1Y1Y7F6_9FUNG|nr:hypothetical protein K493DRAFT_352937 [Basidiobolus meristosporus CBS 931.73]|eukprot:ORX93947.1 hypothetical protein K493DRAFT_352937 [Basidiobolus meristosporus CBS 931.73]